MQKDHELTPLELGKLIVGMRDAYAKGENAMAFARDALAKYSAGGGCKSAHCDTCCL